jgi:hypothetical protein
MGWESFAYEEDEEKIIMETANLTIVLDDLPSFKQPKQNLQHRLLRPFHPTCHLMSLYQTATDPNGLGAVVGDKCMPAKKGFDVKNKFEKVFKKKKSITRR